MAYINDLHNRNQYLENNHGPTLFPGINFEQEVSYKIRTQILKVPLVVLKLI
jgi:hypothetical protein